MRSVIAVVAIALTSPGFLVAPADASGSPELPFRFYSVADGLTQSEVTDIDQDSAGYLWLTTGRGLNRFDGRSFHSLTVTDGLRSNNATALAIAADNTVWIGDGQGGLTVVQDQRVVDVVDPPEGAQQSIIDIQVVDDVVYAIAEGLGLLRVDNRDGSRSLTRVTSADFGIRSILHFQDSVWLVGDNGLFRLGDTRADALDLISADIVHADATEDELWVIDKANRVGIWTGREIDVRAAPAATEELNGITVTSDGTAWVSSRTQLFALDLRYGGAATPVRHYPNFDGVAAMFVDREHTLWLASNSRLVRFLGNRFRHYTLRTGQDPMTVWAITQDSDQRFWFATQRQLMLRNHDETLTPLDESHGIPVAPVRDVVFDGRFLWAGVRNHGVYQIDPVSLKAERISGSEGLDVLDVGVGPNGEVWFATIASGMFRFDPTTYSLERFATPSDAPVYAFEVQDNGSVWYGADDVGLVHLTRLGNGEFQQIFYGEDEGLHNKLFNQIRFVNPDEAWIGMEEGGLYHFVDGGFQRFAGAYRDQNLYVVEPLPDSTLIVGGEQGLYQLVPGTNVVAHYNQLSGFLGLETSVHATYFDHEGRLWVGTVDGASSMDVAAPMAAQLALRPKISRMSTAVGGTPITEGAKIAANDRGAFVEFGAVSLTNPGGIEFSYRLDGLDSAWGPPTTNTSVSYSKLAPGDYRFRVRARHAGGAWSEAVSRRFQAAPFFWQTPWFIAASLLVLALLVRAVLSYRTRSIQMLNDKLTAEVEERTRSIERAKEKLQISNEKLSQQVAERRKADDARAEVEARFRRAFENAPIGMGLLDAGGRLFDANPALLRMLWPTDAEIPAAVFAESIEGGDRERFASLYASLVDGSLESIDEKFSCVDSSGGTLNTDVNLSTVRADDGRFLYSVLQVADVTEALKLTDQLEYQATYDELTGLFNRRAFESQLTRSYEHGHSASVKSYLLYMDLDQFKIVNDTSGHAAGDMLLKNVSEMLVDSVRSNDTVGRLGGDEFAIILWQCPVDVARRIAESIRAAIEAYRFQWDKETYRIGVSIGGIPVDPSIGDISELQQLADAACYAAKDAGRNRVHLVSGERDSARRHRGEVRWVQRLREAMENNRFAIYGQRIKPLDPSITEAERFEVLLRLRDPQTRKLIPPGAFLPAAERYGLSVELDEWVVRSLLNTLFIHQSFEAEHRRFWINLSGTSIGDARFADFLLNMVDKSPLPAGTINFEITENAAIRNVTEATRLMTELRSMGCHFALDDFGSGVSSFQYLKKLPVDYVKIDGAFVRDILVDRTNQIFIKSIIDIAHALGIKTVCEFVENDEMVKAVTDLGADYAQGFAVGRPFVLAPRFPGGQDIESTAELRQIAG